MYRIINKLDFIIQVTIHNINIQHQPRENKVCFLNERKEIINEL